MESFEEFYGDFEQFDSGSIQGKSEFDKIAENRYNDGYREGKLFQEERKSQQGFDDGFERGMKIGSACGALLSRLQIIKSLKPDITAFDSLQSYLKIGFKNGQ